MNITDTTKPRQSIPSKRLLPRLEFKQCIVLSFFVAYKKTLTGNPSKAIFVRAFLFYRCIMISVNVIKIYCMTRYNMIWNE